MYNRCACVRCTDVVKTFIRILFTISPQILRITSRWPLTKPFIPPLPP